MLEHIETQTAGEGSSRIIGRTAGLHYPSNFIAADLAARGYVSYPCAALRIAISIDLRVFSRLVLFHRDSG